MWLTELKTRYMHGYQATPSRCCSFPSHPLHPPHRCPSWWCPGAPRPRWPTPWPPPPSAGSGWSRRFCCSGWSPARLAIGNLGTFSKAETGRGQGQHQLPCFAAGASLCPRAGGLGPLMGEVGIPGESQPWGHFFSWEVESPQEHLCCPPHSGVAEVPLGCLGQQIKALWLQPCLCEQGWAASKQLRGALCRVGWCLKRHQSNIRAVLQLTSLAPGCVHPASYVSYFSPSSRMLIPRIHRHDYTFLECSILNNPSYSIGIK